MKILLCSDGSKKNKNALVFGALVAGYLKAEVTILHVVEDEVDESERIFAEAGVILAKKGVNEYKTKKLKSQADVQILKYAKKKDYDMVIVASHGVQYLRAFLFGNVAIRVIEHIGTHILVVRSSRKKLKKVLFCTGGSLFAKKAVKFGSEIAFAAGAKATIMHVVPDVPGMYRGLGMQGTLNEFLKCDTPECIALKEAANILEKRGIETEVKLRHGLPSEEIILEAEEGDYDLIVMGSHGMSSPARFLLGDVAYKVIKHSKTPCLLVKKQER
ncbi:MAG: hypothetical protein B6U97_04630 [Candidatus Altiarchaeales archaeon ex4484_96]|nr:MAG: hypothetical protein B6U97_04630 [Candidatus Altiarchaeales archaeon ex4484_96]